MYTIIGGDGKEYGPVSVEQVRSWMAGGRANMDTRIRAVGTDEWKTIADFAEITGLSSGSGMAVGSGEVLINLGPKLEILSCYERSWELLKKDFTALIGVSLVFSLLFLVLLYAQKQGLFFLSPLFNGALSGGLAYYFLMKIRGQPATISDAFSGFKKPFVTLVVASLVVSVLVTVGLICLILPGIYLAVAYSFTYILAVDKGIGFWESMEKSRRIVTRNWWRMLGLLLLSIPFILLGIAALGIGIFVAIPLITGAFVYAYEDLCNPGK
jgi:hypothetical protein